MKEPSNWDSSLGYPQHMFWLRNKNFNFPLRTLIWRPVQYGICICKRLHKPLGACDFVICHIYSYSKCSKISNTFLFLFSNKMLEFRAGIHKMLSEKQTGKTLIRLLSACTFCLGTSVRNFRTFTVYCFVCLNWCLTSQSTMLGHFLIVLILV